MEWISSGAFRGCNSLKNINLSDSLTSIEAGLFEGCTNLLSLEIPGSVSYISQFYEFQKDEYNSKTEDYTFYDCRNLSNLRILYSDTELNAVCYFHNGNSQEVMYQYTPWDDWTKNITDLYIDRNLSTPLQVPILEKLEIGTCLQTLPIEDMSTLEYLNTIVSHATVPPVLPHMTNDQYMNINVYVPVESLEAYKADPIWGKFWNLSDVKSVNDSNEKSVIGRYDLSGKPVNEDFKGFVIVRFSDGSTKKIMQ